MEPTKLSYDEATSRIEEILTALEQGEKGMDELAELVKEASALVRQCKLKLRKTADEINSALEEDRID